jgi:hypothetical protein
VLHASADTAAAHQQGRHTYQAGGATHVAPWEPLKQTDVVQDHPRGAIRLTSLLRRVTRHLRRRQGTRTWHRGLQSHGDLVPTLRALEHRVAAIELNLSPAGQGGMLPDAITDSTVFAAYCRTVAARPRRGQLSNRLAVLDQ